MEIAQIIINLGAPEDFSEAACARFLREFLGDPRVLSVPYPLRKFLAWRIAGKRAQSYACNLAREFGSRDNHPIIKYTRNLARSVGELSRIPTFAAFRYGSESVDAAFKRAKACGAKRVRALALYPQNSYSTTQSARACAESAARRCGMELAFADSYCDNKKIVGLFAQSLCACAEDCDAALVSFHSVPISHLDKTNYRNECETTFKLIANTCGLKNIHCVWQSKMGRGDWLSPSAEETAMTLVAGGARRIAVCCAGFPCDCTETLVEIGRDLDAFVRKAGGDGVRLAAAPNDSAAHAETLKEILEELS